MVRRLLLVFFLFQSVLSFGQTAEALLSDMDKIMFGPKDREGTIRITLVNKAGKEKVREALMLQKGPDKRLYRYTKPESQEGVSTLSLPDGIMWLYMPAFGKPKKISMLAKSQAFTGTDFSYDDMATTPYSDRFVPSLVGQKPDGVAIELVPKDDKSDYSKIIVTLQSQFHYPTLMEYYDQRGEKFKEATYTYNKIGKYWNATQVIMTNLKKEHQTIIEIMDVKFDQGLSDDLFEVENMKPQD